MVIHLSTKVLHSNILRFNPKARTIGQLFVYHCFVLTLFNKQNLKSTKQSPLVCLKAAFFEDICRYFIAKFIMMHGQ